jgi:hypothetical protein
MRGVPPSHCASWHFIAPDNFCCLITLVRVKSATRLISVQILSGVGVVSTQYYKSTIGPPLCTLCASHGRLYEECLYTERNNGPELRTQPRRLSWLGRTWNVVEIEWGRYQVITVLSMCLAIGDSNTQSWTGLWSYEFSGSEL